MWVSTSGAFTPAARAFLEQEPVECVEKPFELETIRGLHAKGVTIIWIEHVLHALNSVVERLLVLDFGKVIGIGLPAEIMASKDVREIYLGMEV